MALDAVLDHVAVAVPDLDKAQRRWGDALGGGVVTGGDSGVFANRQVRYAGGGRLELLAPSPAAQGPTFVTGFLERFGAQVHHMTLKVPDLDVAIEELRGAGLDVVDVNLDSDVWQEAFLRPSQVGGLVVQVAHSTYGEEDWARAIGREPQEPHADAAWLLGPTLAHPDLDRAGSLWALLGATVADEGDGLRCTWPDSALDVVVVPGEPGPLGLRMAGTEPLEPEAGVGPAVLPP